MAIWKFDTNKSCGSNLGFMKACETVNIIITAMVMYGSGVGAILAVAVKVLLPAVLAAGGNPIRFLLPFTSLPFGVNNSF